MQQPNIDYLEHPELDDRLREPLDDEEREFMDPDTWDWENIQEGTPNPDPHGIFEVRLSLDEVSQIEPAAIAKGMTVGAFMRYAALRGPAYCVERVAAPPELPSQLPVRHQRRNYGFGRVIAGSSSTGRWSS